MKLFEQVDKPLSYWEISYEKITADLWSFIIAHLLSPIQCVIAHAYVY